MTEGSDNHNAKQDILASVRGRLSKAVTSLSDEGEMKQGAGGEHLRRILDISEVMNTTRDIDELFVYVIDRLIELFQAERGFLIMLDEKGQCEFKAARDLEGANIADPHDEVSHTVIEKAADRRKPILVENALTEEDFRGRASVKDLSLLAVMCTPLMARDKLLGVIYVDNRSVPGRFSERDLSLLRIFANQAGVAIENARLFKALQDAQDQVVMAEKLRALGQMSAGVAHNFNNVLTSILGTTQLMLAQPQDPVLRDELERIECAALDGANAVKRIQEFARPRSASTFYDIDVTQIVEDSAKMTETQWRVKAEQEGTHYAVDTDLMPGLTVRGLESELREVLVCMILNALDAMPRGGMLRLTSGLEDDCVYIEVADTGRGMSDDVRKRVFDPFFTTKGLNGSGLGLSTAYGIVSAHKGRIEVSTDIGKGTTFTILLPQVRKETARQPRRRTPAPLAPGIAANVLLVDDDERIRYVLKSMLIVGGHEVHAASSGEEAIRLVGETDFDLVLTDLAMPTMSGWEVADSVKQIRPRTIVAVVTGFGPQIDESKMKEHGVDLLLGKPMRIPDVENLVAQAMVLRSRPSAR